MKALIERKRVGGVRVSVSLLVEVILRDLTGLLRGRVRGGYMRPRAYDTIPRQVKSTLYLLSPKSYNKNPKKSKDLD